MKTPSKISSVILWSVISAAFIGPGTVTTAVTAGSQFGLDLLWTVVFATVGCIVLQEVSARITIASGMTFGQSLIKKFGATQGKYLQWLIGGSVLVGCAAYEAGNILGAVSGLNLITGLQTELLTVFVSITAAAILWMGGKNWISSTMMVLVAVMGIAFTALALSQDFSFQNLAASSITPVIPPGAELIVLGLVGTTIVPYNIFIGAGISKGETIPLMRIGLIVSISIGGIITAAILMAGISIESFSSFGELAQSMTKQMGWWGGIALAWGLFAAGFSSAITSPFASAIVASTVFEFKSRNTIRWVWISVLLTGFFFGISGIKPIPVILAVQAINGLVLPLLTLYLIMIVNDAAIVPTENQHGRLYNLLLLVILFAVVLIGLNNIDKSISTFFHLAKKSHFILALTISILTVAFTGLHIFRK